MSTTTQHVQQRFGDILFYGVMLLLVYLVFRIFEPFLLPLGWAGVLAVVFYSSYKKIERRMGATYAAALSTAGVTAILIIPVLVLTLVFVREGVQIAHTVQTSIESGNYGWLGRAWTWLVGYARTHGGIDLPDVLRQAFARFGQYLATTLGQVVRNVVVFVFELFVTLFALFFFFRDGDRIMRRLRDLLPFEQRTREGLIGSTRDLIFASVNASLVIAAAQGLVCGGAFAIVGLALPIFWGIVMAFLSLLPVVGAWPVWISAAIWLLSTGHAVRGLVLVAICAGVGGTIDNVLRPVLMAGRASLSGLLVFVGVLGGVDVFGLLGIVLGPIVLAAAISIFNVYTRNSDTGVLPTPAHE
jgi:predicted PurR-regulated permease PerM